VGVGFNLLYRTYAFGPLNSASVFPRYEVKFSRPTTRAPVPISRVVPDDF
jgi:hypothetical protein